MMLCLISMRIVSYAQNVDYRSQAQVEFDKGEAPGFAVVVLKEGEVVYKDAFGFADVKKKNAITSDTRFLIGSFSKQFTAMAIMLLVEQGNVELDEKVRTYLPGLPQAYDAVTVRHLLTHTSGIKSDFKKRSKKPFLNESMVGDDLIQALQGVALEFAPGDKMSYSNASYGLLYMIIEEASQQPFREFLKQHIFDPLNMNRTTSISHDNIDLEGLAVGYGLNKKKFRKVSPVLRPGGGSLVSTIEDLIRWEKGLHNGTLIPNSKLEEMWTPVVLNDGAIANMGKDNQGRYYQAGFGWFIGDENERGLIHHSGGVDGYASNIDRFRDAGLTVIALCNIENGTAVTLTNALAEVYFAQ